MKIQHIITAVALTVTAGLANAQYAQSHTGPGWNSPYSAYNQAQRDAQAQLSRTGTINHNTQLQLQHSADAIANQGKSQAQINAEAAANAANARKAAALAPAPVNLGQSTYARNTQAANAWAAAHAAPKR